METTSKSPTTVIIETTIPVEPRSSARAVSRSRENKITVLRLLWSRRSDNREAVSSVLNIADGLVGRMLRLHILCSVNARLNELDPAIMRPGRLMNQRAFRRLPPNIGRGRRGDFRTSACAGCRRLRNDRLSGSD